MANYSNIKGFTVQTVSSDPAATQLDTGSWASSSDLNTARAGCTGTSDSTTNSIMMGGYYLPPTVNRSVTESYDGTSWTELAEIPISVVYGNGLGVKTASMVAGADISAAPKNSNAYIFNGSSWTAPGASLNTMKFMSATGGTTTAGIIAGGNNPPGTPKEGTTETWDGTSFTEVADLNTAKSDIGGGTGTSTALMSASGSPGTTEIYNGSSWTEIAELNTTRQNASKGGTTTAAIVSNGLNGGYTGKTEMYDGTSWTEVGDTPTSFAYAGNLSSGNSNGQNNSIIAGGQNNEGQTGRTLEWTTTPSALFSKQVEGQLFFNSTTNTFKETLKVAPSGSWASGGDLNTARGFGNGTGASNTVGLAFGGANPGVPADYALTEQYNGTSWTEVGDLNAVRREFNIGTCGPYTDCMLAGGSPSPANTFTETWNGSSWTEVADLNTGRYGMGIAGENSTASIVAAGETGGYRAQVEQWNGSAWTEVADVSPAGGTGAGIGTSTSALLVGRQGPPNDALDVVESWNGSSWTEIAEFNTNRRNAGAAGTSNTSGMIYGGAPPTPRKAQTEIWDGTSWTEVSDLATIRAGVMGGGTIFSALASGGPASAPTYVATTEEWDAALSNKTITST